MTTAQHQQNRPEDAQSARLLLPPASVASCIALAVVRDTRGRQLEDKDRLNFFPASPLVTLTVVIEGQIHMATRLSDLDSLRATAPLTGVFVSPPQPGPIFSWSPGQIVAISIGFFPDAWCRLGGGLDATTVPDGVSIAIDAIDSAENVSSCFDRFCWTLAGRWTQAKRDRGEGSWDGSSRISDWVRHILLQSAMSGPGRSVRAMERRLKRWTGHSRQSLEFFAQVDTLHGLAHHAKTVSAAEIAQDGAFSDQSHMGRAVKRATGFSPVRLNKLIESEEAFWCYRILGERF